MEFTKELLKLTNFVEWAEKEFRSLTLLLKSDTELSLLSDLSSKKLSTYLKDLQTFQPLANDLDLNFSKSQEIFLQLKTENRQYCIEFSAFIDSEITLLESLAKEFSLTQNIDINYFIWTEDETCEADLGLLKFSNRLALISEGTLCESVCEKNTCGGLSHFLSVFRFYAEVLAKCKQLVKVWIILQLGCEKHEKIFDGVVKMVLGESRTEKIFDKIEKDFLVLVRFKAKLKKSVNKLTLFGTFLLKQTSSAPRNPCIKISTHKIKRFAGEKLKILLALVGNWLEKLELLTLAEIESPAAKRRSSVFGYQPRASLISATQLIKFFSIKQTLDRKLDKENFIQTIQMLLTSISSNKYYKQQQIEALYSILRFFSEETSFGKHFLKHSQVRSQSNKPVRLKHSYTFRKINTSRFENYSKVLNREASGKVPRSSSAQSGAQKTPNRLTVLNKNLSTRFDVKFHRSSYIQLINNKKVFTMSFR